MNCWDVDRQLQHAIGLFKWCIGRENACLWSKKSTSYFTAYSTANGHRSEWKIIPYVVYSLWLLPSDYYLFCQPYLPGLEYADYIPCRRGKMMQKCYLLDWCLQSLVWSKPDRSFELKPASINLLTQVEIRQMPIFLDQVFLTV